MTWQSSLPRVSTIATWPLLCTERKWCFWRAARSASTAMRTFPSVPFLKPTGAERPEASSRCTWLSVVRAPMAPQDTRSPMYCGEIMDGARADHDQQAVGSAMENLADLAPRLGDERLDRRALDRKEADQVLRRRQRNNAGDSLVVRERGLVSRFQRGVGRCGHGF